MIVWTLIKKYIWPMIALVGTIAVFVVRSMWIKEGKEAERAKSNDIAIKSTIEAENIRDKVDTSGEAIRNDPDNRRNSGV